MESTSTLLFQSVIADPPPVILIEDTIEDEGEALFIHLISQWYKLKRNILVLCFDKPPTYYKSYLSRLQQRKESRLMMMRGIEGKISTTEIEFIDFFSDPEGWNSNNGCIRDDIGSSNTTRTVDMIIGSEEKMFQLPKNCNEFVEMIKNVIQDTFISKIEGKGGEVSPCILLIDSLSYLILKYTSSETSKLLKRLSRECLFGTNRKIINKNKIGEDLSISPIVEESNPSKRKERHDLVQRGTVTGVFHRDVFNPSTSDMTQLEYATNVIIHFFGERTFNILSKFGSGKIVVESNIYGIDEVGGFIVKKGKQSVVAAPSFPLKKEKMDDIIGDLTFSLKRTKEEENAKQNVHLPYMQQQHNKRQPKTDSEVIIAFEEDEDDDGFFDDPDDDLDI